MGTCELKTKMKTLIKESSERILKAAHQEGEKMNPHYYIMKCKKILRLEEETSFQSLPSHIREKCLEIDIHPLNQEQANWRVVLFRDEIMEMDEYLDWLNSPEAFEIEELEYELAAN